MTPTPLLLRFFASGVHDVYGADVVDVGVGVGVDVGVGVGVGVDLCVG